MRLRPCLLAIAALVVACGKDQPASQPPSTAAATPADADADAEATAADDFPTDAPIPEGYTSLTPQIAVFDVDEALKFYTAAFDAQTLMAVKGPDGATFHAEIQIGDSRVLVEREDDEWMSPSATGWTSATLMLYVDDCDAVFKRALEAGAKSKMPVAEQYWGDRYGRLVDPSGHRWAIATHVEDLTDAQMQERAKVIAGGGKSPGGKGRKKKRGRRRGSKASAPPAWKAVAGTPASRPTPDGYRTLTIALTVNNAAQALAFYTKAFGATERNRTAGPDGKLVHAEVQIGDSVLTLSDSMPGRGRIEPPSAHSGVPPLMVHHYVPNADAAFNAAMSAGGQVILPTRDVFWGDRFAVVAGPDGYGWGIAARAEALPPEEYARRLQEAAGGPPPAPPTPAAAKGGAPPPPPPPPPPRKAGKNR